MVKIYKLPWGSLYCIQTGKLADKSMGKNIWKIEEAEITKIGEENEDSSS